MKAAVPNEWQRRRSHFNHQWLKNRFLSALDTVANLLSGRIRGDTFVIDFINNDLSEWKVRESEARKLLSDFEEQMSPRALFQNPPLAAWEAPLREATANLVHELWLARYSIRSLVAEVTVKLEFAQATYNELNLHITSGASLFASEEARRCFQEFRVACRALSRAIEKFPSRILVV